MDNSEGGVGDCPAGGYFSLAGHPGFATPRPSASSCHFIILSQHIMGQNNLAKAFGVRVSGRNRWSLGGTSRPLAGRYWFVSGELRSLARLI